MCFSQWTCWACSSGAPTPAFCSRTCDIWWRWKAARSSRSDDHSNTVLCWLFFFFQTPRSFKFKAFCIAIALRFTEYIPATVLITCVRWRGDTQQPKSCTFLMRMISGNVAKLKKWKCFSVKSKGDSFFFFWSPVYSDSPTTSPLLQLLGLMHFYKVNISAPNISKHSGALAEGWPPNIKHCKHWLKKLFFYQWWIKNITFLLSLTL